jgi:hypothetical protein
MIDSDSEYRAEAEVGARTWKGDSSMAIETGEEVGGAYGAVSRCGVCRNSRTLGRERECRPCTCPCPSSPESFLLKKKHYHKTKKVRINRVPLSRSGLDPATAFGTSLGGTTARRATKEGMPAPALVGRMRTGRPCVSIDVDISIGVEFAGGIDVGAGVVVAISGNGGRSDSISRGC